MRHRSFLWVVLASVELTELPPRNGGSDSETGAANARVRGGKTAVHMVRYARLEDPAPQVDGWSGGGLAQANDA